MDVYAQCVAQISLDTSWHKTTKTSSLSGTFWMDPEQYVANDSDLVTMINPVVAGTTGAWGKADNIQNVALAPIAGSANTNYRLTIDYKVSHATSIVQLTLYIYSINEGQTVHLLHTETWLEPRRLLSGFILDLR